MRRILSGLLASLMVVGLGATASAASDVRVVLDGQEIEFDEAPYLESERTMVPVRALAEALGFEVAWDEAQRMVTLTKGEDTIQLWIDSDKAVVNGEEVKLDAPARQVNDRRTFVPLRFVCEGLDSIVKWDGDTNTVTITSEDALIEKLNSMEASFLNQKGTANFTMAMEMTMEEADQPAETMSMDMNMDMAMHMYDEDMLMTMTVKPSADPLTGEELEPMTMQVVLKDGTMFMNDGTTPTWYEFGTINFEEGELDLSGMTGMPMGFNPMDMVEMAEEMTKDVKTDVIGVEQLDGVETIKVVMDFSKVDFGQFLNQFFTMMIPEEAGIPVPEMTIDAFTVTYWLDADTLFNRQSEIDAQMVMSMADETGSMTMKMTMNGLMKSEPTDEPIQFPAMESIEKLEIPELPAEETVEGAEPVTPEPSAPAEAETPVETEAPAETEAEAPAEAGEDAPAETEAETPADAGDEAPVETEDAAA